MSLSDPSVEKSAYYYRKVLDLNIIKGGFITAFVVGFTRPAEKAISLEPKKKLYKLLTQIGFLLVVLYSLSFTFIRLPNYQL